MSGAIIGDIVGSRKDACKCERTPEKSYQRIFEHFKTILPEATDKQITKLMYELKIN